MFWGVKGVLIRLSHCCFQLLCCCIWYDIDLFVIFACSQVSQLIIVNEAYENGDRSAFPDDLLSSSVVVRNSAESLVQVALRLTRDTADEVSFNLYNAEMCLSSPWRPRLFFSIWLRFIQKYFGTEGTCSIDIKTSCAERVNNDQSINDSSWKSFIDKHNFCRSAILKLHTAIENSKSKKNI